MTASQIVEADLNDVCEELDEDLTSMAGRRLLITGGAGFLGHYLVQVPLFWNHLHPSSAPISVTVFDNLERGMPTWLSAFLADPNLTLVQHDMRLPLPSDTPDFDYIVHAAGIASPRYYRLHPIETMDTNINGLRNLLDHSVRQAHVRPLAGFLFFSSSEIYGDPTPDAIPTPETYRGLVSCTGPRACYDESKRFGETLCVNFAGVHGLPVKVARPFNNYGPGMKITDGRVIADFARDIISGNNIVMFSDGSPTRTFCYVADAVAGYFRILTRGRPGEAYNIGTEGPEVSVAELAQRMTMIASQVLGYTGSVVRKPSPEAAFLVDNPYRRRPAIGKASTDLGFEPRTSLDQGLARTLEWYIDNQGGEDR